MSQTLSSRTKTLGFTVAALLAFAANSVFCRMALKEGAIDASGFTVIRLLSGVVMFVVLLSLRKTDTTKKPSVRAGRWWAAMLLFLYAVTFSFAYISLDAGTGALVLFGAVQITMIVASLLSGNRLRAFEWLGLAISSAVLVYLVYPTITTPSVWGFLLMCGTGVAWGLYTLAGRGSTNPIGDTAVNFALTIPFVVVLALLTLSSISVSVEGVVLAMLSGALASAFGYAIWYTALTGLSVTEAAVVQLLVPVIAAMGGVVFVSEPITARLVIASVLVLGGIYSVVVGRSRLAQKRT